MSDRHALLISNGKYADTGLAELQSPISDVTGLEAVLGDPALGGFETSTITDQPYFEVVERLGEFLDNRSPKDTLIIYISGHGLKNADGELFFATANTRLSRIDETAIPAETLARQMRRSRARKILLVLDCCYSAAFAFGKGSKGSEKVSFTSFEGSGHIIMTASDATQYAFEGGALTSGDVSAGMSVFTEAVVLGIRTGDADVRRAGLITVTDLFQYVSQTLSGVQPQQTPTVHASGMQGEFLVSKNPNVEAIAPSAVDHGSLAQGPVGQSLHVSYLSDLVDGFLDAVEARAGNDMSFDKVFSTGHVDLDEIMAGGYRPGDLTLITGPSGVGKSIFALGVVRNASIRGNANSFVLSLESSDHEMLHRIFCAEARVALNHVRNGVMNDDDWSRLARTMATVSSSPLAFIDEPDVTIGGLREFLQEHPHRDLVVVDSLQLVADSAEPADMVAAVRDLKLIAKATDVAIIATVGQDRALGDSVSPLSVIDRYADFVIEIFRDDQFEPESFRPGEAELIVRKNRHGFTRTVTVAFQGHYARFVDMAQ